MASDKEYQALLDSYNRLIARYKDLEEQMRTKKDQWSKVFSDAKHVDNAARLLCNKILENDKSEMKLGEEYTWSKIPTLELLTKAIKSLDVHNTQKKDILLHLVDANEAAHAEVESLKEQIAIMLNRMESNSAAAPVDIEKQVKQEIADNQEIERLPNDIQENVANGYVRIKAITTNDEDAADIDDFIQEAFETSESITSPTKSSIPIIAENKQKKRTSKMHIIDLEEYEKKMNDTAWEVLAQMGTNGYSRYAIIEASLMKKNPTLTASRIRTALFSMRSAGIVSVNDVFCPLIPHLKVYTLTEMGQRLYKSKFGNVAKMSESEKVIAEHDNLSHGYGILSVAEVIRQSNQFDSVTTNRKVNTIHLHNGIEYIPDIVCKTDKTTIYVEYEMGTHTQTDFNNKCGKMLMASKNLYFVVPNQDVLRESMVPKIQKWVDSKSKQVLSGAKIYLTTAQNLSQCNFSDDSTWRILFDLNKSNKPQEQGM